MDKKVIYTKKDIAASLEYGERISTPGVVLLWLMLILGIVLSFFPFCGIMPLDTDEDIMAMIGFFVFTF